MKAVDAKKKLLEHSVKLIEEEGLGALSFREMARRAGVSHQAPYHHFENRDGILAALALEGFRQLDDMLVKAAADGTGKSAEEVLRAMMAAYVTFALDRPVHFRIMFRPELVEVEKYPEAQAVAAQTFERFIEAVARCHPGVSRRSKPFTERVNALWAATHGVATLWLDGNMKSITPGLSLPSFLAAATELYARAGATPLARSKPKTRR
ncbi:MAG: TetR/AcrR family transcriptional regulator [Parvibaculum sp.]|nr:TetR/AcrR family transcriptional regulator [Parvibaculum sp.]